MSADIEALTAEITALRAEVLAIVNMAGIFYDAGRHDALGIGPRAERAARVPARGGRAKLALVREKP